MCGIIGRVGDGNCVPELLTGLQNLEYRGYDSAGIAVKGRNGGRPMVVKCRGEIDRLIDLADGFEGGCIGIGHTRWSTHGPPTDANAHPHADCTETVAVVHNGIIENYDEIRKRLLSLGHEFGSDTDTEVVPHLVEEYRKNGLAVEAAFRRAVDDLSGSYAIALIVEGEDAIYAARNGSPLVLGVDDGAYYLASDVPAFLEFTDDVVYLDDGDVVVVTPDGYRVSNPNGSATRSVETVDWDPEDAAKGPYDHFMLKEIHEQSTALRQATEGRVDPDNDEVVLDDFPPGSFDGVDEVQFVACGTSYNAACYAAHLFARRGIAAQPFLASEFATTPPPIDDSTLVVGVTQSGETADTLAALRTAEERGSRTLAVTNVVGSTAARECDEALFIHAGPEIGVAATKTFSSQVVTLVLLAERVCRDLTGESGPDSRAMLEALVDLPEMVQYVLDTSSAASIAHRYIEYDTHFFIGRGTARAVALEGALKFKEITYEHAEGFAAGELKHGPLALVTDETPVFAIITGEHGEKTLNNMEEVHARGAPVIAVTSEGSPTPSMVADVLTVPETHPDLACILANVQLQLLSYHAASIRGRSIDKPRNLAKSVTVE